MIETNNFNSCGICIKTWHKRQMLTNLRKVGSVFTKRKETSAPLVSVYFQSAAITIVSWKNANSAFLTTPASEKVCLQALAHCCAFVYLKFCGGWGCECILFAPAGHHCNAVKCNFDCVTPAVLWKFSFSVCVLEAHRQTWSRHFCDLACAHNLGPDPWLPRISMGRPPQTSIGCTIKIHIPSLWTSDRDVPWKI